MYPIWRHHWKIQEHNSYILHRMGLLMIIRILIISFSLYQSFRPQNKVSFKWYWKLISINRMTFNKALYYLHVFNVFSLDIKIKLSIWHYKSVYLTNDTVCKIPNRSICWIYICMIIIFIQRIAQFLKDILERNFNWLIDNAVIFQSFVLYHEVV